MDSPDHIKQRFLDFMDQKQPAWTPSAEATSALSKSSCAVIQSDGSFPYHIRSHGAPSLPCESSNQSTLVIKEHDYIGLGEVSSPCSSVNENDSVDALDDTDLRLGLGPIIDDLNVSHASSKKAEPCLQLGLLEPQDRAPTTPQGPHLAFGFNPASGHVSSRHGFKRGYGEATNEVQCKALQEPQQNVFVPTWHISKSTGFYPHTNGHDGLQSFEPAFVEARPAKGQVVGWPPIRSYRKSTLVIAQSQPDVNGDGQSAMYVKVNMDGVPIGRKMDLNAYGSYESLLAALEEMFYSPSNGNGAHFLTTSDFVLTYEDKEGDWMLVGDVPWRMFVNTVRRLRIVRGSEATGFGPRTCI